MLNLFLETKLKTHDYEDCGKLILPRKADIADESAMIQTIDHEANSVTDDEAH